MEKTDQGVQIKFLPATDDDDAFWQEECRHLLNSLQMTVEDLPEKIQAEQLPPSGDGSRAGALELFSSMLMSAATLGPLFDRGWDIFQDFLNRHQSCTATLRMPDGSEVQLNNLSKEEALSIYREGIEN